MYFHVYSHVFFSGVLATPLITTQMGRDERCSDTEKCSKRTYLSIKSMPLGRREIWANLGSGGSPRICPCSPCMSCIFLRISTCSPRILNVFLRMSCVYPCVFSHNNMAKPDELAVCFRAELLRLRRQETETS